ncbi:APC family permease [Companilactobacillus metriopterae]|uniref:APC family permease n=1 Tax=Companilactobacillus metriopterae TaxID=1909267 RepID=UPI00100C02CA|nr:amino acid permease [Companilactobacillus metriopterae]
MDNKLTEITSKKSYISWPVIALLDFVTVISFDDLIYNFKNQGLGVVTTWILMLVLFVVPYEMMVGNLGSAFSGDSGGLTSWVRETSGNTWGYICAWVYWISCLPYIVDVANSTLISFGWILTGNNSISKSMSNSTFALLTAAIFITFIFIQHRLKNSIKWLAIIGGSAMFIITVLYVMLTFVYLGTGNAPSTQPFNLKSFIPKLDLHYISTFSLVIFAMSGSEYVGPYISQMKDGKRDFPKAMWLLAIMTGFLTVLGSFSLGVFFNAHSLPHDLKMNGSYYAFEAMGNHFGLGKLFLYTFSITQAIYMMAQLAVLLDAGTRMFLSDTAKDYLPKALTKLDKRGLPINGYWLTAGICTFIMVLSATLPNMNDIFNQLLSLNGIISPYASCFVFSSFIILRFKDDKFNSEFRFINNRNLAIIAGIWCLTLTFSAATLGIIPADAKFGTTTWYHTLILNISEPLIMVAIGAILPIIAKYERRN